MSLELSLLSAGAPVDLLNSASAALASAASAASVDTTAMLIGRTSDLLSPSIDCWRLASRRATRFSIIRSASFTEVFSRSGVSSRLGR